MCDLQMLMNYNTMDNNLYDIMSYRTSPFSNTSLDSRDSTSNGSAMSSMSPASANLSSPESINYSITDMDVNNCITAPHMSMPFFGINENMNNEEPYLIITEQPVDKFRFRYRSEMMGTHGSLMARSAEKNKKVYPTVKLMNYTGEAVVRCSLYQVDKHNRTPHTHHLVLRNPGSSEESCDPHDVVVSTETGYQVVFPGMGIIHTAKKFIATELVNKQLAVYKKRNHKPKHSELQEIKDQAHQDARSMNLNSVCLCFEAFDRFTMEPICEKVFSTPINNMKSALTGELKIVRLSKNSSSCLGNEELFMFVEKVGKKNIKVKFFELSDNEEEIWYDYGKFSELDVHHQYAIALRTPAYRDINIESPVNVYIQLYRPSDGDFSEPMKFTYKPSSRISNTERKRARMESCFNSMELIENLPTVLNTLPTSDQQCLLNDTEYESVDNITLSDNFKLMNSDEFKNFLALLPKETYVEFENNMSDEVSHTLRIDGCVSPSKLDHKVQEKPRIGSLKPLDTSKLMENTAEKTLTSSSHGKHNYDPNETNANQKSMMTKQIRPEIQPEMMGPQGSDLEANLKSILMKLLRETRSEYLRNNETRMKTNRNMILELFLNGKNGNTILHDAIQANKMSIVRDVLQLFVHYDICEKLNQKSCQGKTVLHTAIEHGNYTYIKPLLAAGIDPNIPDNEGHTPLHLAVLLKSTIAVNQLLNKQNYKSPESLRLDVNKTNNAGCTALYLAAENGEKEMVEKLLIAQADINIAETLLGNTVLHVAVDRNHEDIVKILLLCPKVKVNATNRQGHTPLHLACVVDTGAEKGSKKIVEMLLEAKADPTLAYLQIGPENVVKEEPNSDDDTDTEQNPDNNTSFELASSNPAILQLLTKYAINNDDPYYITPKVELMECGDPETVHDLSKVKEEFKNHVIFDEICTNRLSAILDKSGNWEKLAELLDYSSLTTFMANSKSPTRVLLGHIENADTSLQTIVDLLRALDEDKAVEAIDAMLARHNATL